MTEDKPRLSRLTAMVTQLQSKRIVTAKEIAEKHNVSIRTVYRDIRTLEKSGIPIITEEGKGYSIMEGYKIPPVMFTQEEANALITAEQLIKKNKDQSLIEHYESAILKIKSVLKYSQKEKSELLINRIQVRNNLENEKTSNHLIQLQSAVSNYQTIKIDYLSLKNEQSQREIEPFALYTTQDNWVLIAFCKLKNDFRAFRIDCIQNLQTLESNFEPHKMTLQQYLDKCGEKYKDTPDTPMAQGQSTFALNHKIE
jgi:predicted DNA-binding transcriptional regulator YafY